MLTMTYDWQLLKLVTALGNQSASELSATVEGKVEDLVGGAGGDGSLGEDIGSGLGSGGKNCRHCRLCVVNV